MKWLMRVLAALSGAALVLSLLLFMIRGVALDRSHYMEQYRANDTARVIGTDEEGLDAVTDNIIEYLAGRTDDLTAEVSIHGVRREFYNRRELDHMVDVQNVMNLANVVSYVLLGFAALVLLLCYILPKRFRIDPFRPLLIGGGLGLLALIAIGLYAYFDFYHFWMSFHGVLFTNDLWLLNPATDNLINLVPEPFFYATCMKILIRWGLILLVLTGALITARVVSNRKKRIMRAGG